MHCPNCGTKASAGQKFCRACGFSLEKVEQLIADQQAAATEQTSKATAGLSDDWLRRLEKWAARALFIVLMILAAAALALFLAYLDSERRKSASARSNQQHRLPQAQETAKMLSEANAEMAVSVTEQTTARLEEKLES